MKKIFLILAIILVATSALAADVNLKWDPAEGATGYRIYMSADSGATWQAPVDVGNVTEYVYQGVPDSGLILFRVSSYNQNGETVKCQSGCWFRGDWIPPASASGLSGD